MPVICLLALVCVAPASATSFGQPVGGRVLLNWAPEEIGKAQTYTTARAVEQARRWDVIVAQPSTFSASIGQMHAANPNLAVIGYMKGLMALPSQGSTYPADEYSYDANGNKITNPQYGTYLMNPASPGWISDRIATCQSLLAASGYDGCMLDSLGAGALKAGYDSGLPINPATGQVWTKTDWLNANAALAQAVRSAVSPALVIGNNLIDPVPALPPDLALLPGMDGGIAEGFLRTATAGPGVYPTPTIWQQTVDMLPQAQSQGKPVLVLTKLWTTATPGQVTAWHLFTLASFLLGTDGTSLFFFSASSAEHPVLTTPWTVDIGDPTGPYALQDGVYQRPFTNGLVLVNPSSAPVAVPVAGSYVDATGAPVSGSITMGPNTGQILTAAFTTLPSAPSNVVAAAGDSAAQVSFAAATSAVGDPVTSYTVTASDLSNPVNGGQTQTVTGSPATFTGLTDGDSYAFTVTAANAVGSGPASPLSNAVVPQVPVHITTTSVPWGVSGLAYSTTLKATAGITPYKWTIGGGALPPGLKLATSGTISGTPTAAGTYTFTATVTDGSLPITSASRSYTLAVYAPAPAGSGTETVSPTTAKAGSSGKVFKLTYTVSSAGALSGGKLRITVPAGWTAPSTVATNAGRVTTSQGTVAVSGQVVTISGLKQLPGAVVTVTYGSLANGNTGVRVGPAGTYTFATAEASLAANALVALGVSPSVTVS